MSSPSDQYLLQPISKSLQLDKWEVGTLLKKQPLINRLTFIRGLGAGALPLILAVFAVLFGAHKIPELANGLCKGIREFKQAMKDI